MNDSAGRRGGAVVSEKSPMVPEENKVGYGGVGVVGIDVVDDDGRGHFGGARVVSVAARVGAMSAAMVIAMSALIAACTVGFGGRAGISLPYAYDPTDVVEMKTKRNSYSGLGAALLPGCQSSVQDHSGVGPPTVLFGILSAKSLRGRRDALRKTWIKSLDSWPCAAHVFLEAGRVTLSSVILHYSILTVWVSYIDCMHSVTIR